MRLFVDGSNRCRDLCKRQVDQFRCDDAVEEARCKRFIRLVHLAKRGGRTSDLLQAIRDHASPGSEANQVVQSFLGLAAPDQQDVVNFLRSL